MTTQWTVDVLGHRMAYVEAGAGDPILLLHGNPTSSYLWRNVIPHLKEMGRCVAPDLIGFGQSDKLPPTRGDGEDDRYTFDMHAQHLEAFIEAVCPSSQIVLVLHDWGSALGLDWACRHEARVRGIVYMESMIAHRRYSDMALKAALVFFGVRNSKWIGRKLILERNLFVEQGLPGYVLRSLSDEEMNTYREPFLGDPEDRRPILSFQRELPVNGRPRRTHERFERYMAWLKTTRIPKLFINAEPGYQLAGQRREIARSFANQREVTVRGLHYVQEDAHEEIGGAIAGWLKDVAAGPRLVDRHERAATR